VAMHRNSSFNTVKKILKKIVFILQFVAINTEVLDKVARLALYSQSMILHSTAGRV
jgi:hypothetical protein